MKLTRRSTFLVALSLAAAAIVVEARDAGAAYTLPANFKWATATPALLKVAVPQIFQIDQMPSGQGVSFKSQVPTASVFVGELFSHATVPEADFDKFVLGGVKGHIHAAVLSGPHTKVVVNGLDCLQAKGTGVGQQASQKLEWTMFQCVGGKKSAGFLFAFGEATKFTTDPAYLPLTTSISPS